MSEDYARGGRGEGEGGERRYYAKPKFCQFAPISR